MNYSEYIVRDAKICGGEPVFVGNRVTLRTILASLAVLMHRLIKDQGNENP